MLSKVGVHGVEGEKPWNENSEWHFPRGEHTWMSYQNIFVKVKESDWCSKSTKYVGSAKTWLKCAKQLKFPSFWFCKVE